MRPVSRQPGGGKNLIAYKKNGVKPESWLIGFVIIKDMNKFEPSLWAMVKINRL